VTSAEAKAIITKPETFHVCYCLTPTRYLWSSKATYESSVGLMGAGLRLLSPTLRRWDEVVSTRPDHYIAISNRVRERINTYYHRDADVIYPPVIVRDQGSEIRGQKDSYFLVVSRLVPYKRIDIIIDAFNKLGWPLTIIGDGMDKHALKKRAKGNITFIDRYLTEEELHSYYGSCRALIHAADEDFGIVAVEALAAGKPVISFRESAVSEIIDEHTGITFEEQTKHAIMSALEEFSKRRFDPRLAKKRAEQFSEEQFIQTFKRTIDSFI